MKKIILTIAMVLFLAGQVFSAIPANQDARLINQIGHNILTANHLPNADFVITDDPDTFDDYFIKANTFKTVELFTWELSFANDPGEVAAIVARQIGKISNNMPTQARSQAKTNTIQISKRVSYESKHIYSYEKLNKDKVDMAADRTGVDFMIQSGINPLALISVYGKYLDYEEDVATERIMNVYDYMNYNFPDRLKYGYPTDSFKKAVTVINQQLASRTELDKQRVLEQQAKINEKKLKQANSGFKAFNPWNSSYTTLQLHR